MKEQDFFLGTVFHFTKRVDASVINTEAFTHL
jgi:hypothetical protein